jgi:Mg-chelatase subunit ChlD
MNAVKKKMKRFSKIVFLVLAALVMSVNGWSQNHDLIITPAPDITSPDAVDWKSPDIKVGADFGDTSVPDIVQRGVPNSIFARFRINGMQDHTIPSGDIQIKFYYRSAGIGDTPPAFVDSEPAPGSDWTYIGRLLVTYITADGPFTVTRVWPTGFPSVTTKAITWTPPTSGDYFHVAAVLVYPSGTTDENPDDNVAVSLYESQSGLIDVVLLFDESGSMGGYTYNGYTYMELAKSKASMFVSSMNEAHRLGVVSFSTRHAGGSVDIWDAPAPLLQPATDTDKTNAGAAISGLSAGGGTPLGQGMERAIDVLTSESDPDRKKVILLLSDGYENYGTPRACDGGDPAVPCVSGSILTQLQANNIRVFTIALGTAAWTECLECLANESGGQWYSSPDAGINLSDVLLAIHEAYTGDDLYRVDRGVSGGGDDTYSTYFEGIDNVLYFILSWDDLNANLELKLYPPGRTRLNTKVFEGKGYQVIKVKNPMRGLWKYTVTGDEGKDYLAAVRSDKVGVRLGMDVKVEGLVGGDFKIIAKVAAGIRPITNAQPTATVQIPVGLSLNTILQQTSRAHMIKYKTAPVSPKVLQKNPDISPRAAFISTLVKDKQEPLVKTRTVTVPLEHKGKGIYAGVLKKDYTTTAGQYHVTVTTNTSRFNRNYSKQVRLNPGKIDYKKSFAEVITVKSPGGQPDYLLRVNAVDKFGNAITHPTLMNRVKVQVKDARLYREPEIKLGAFQRKLTVIGQKKPVLDSVTIDGRTVEIKNRTTITR